MGGFLPWVGGQREGCRERTRGRRRGPPGPRTARRAPRRGSTRGSEGRTARSTAGAGRWRFGSRGLVAAADGGSRGAVSGPGGVRVGADLMGCVSLGSARTRPYLVGSPQLRPLMNVLLITTVDGRSDACPISYRLGVAPSSPTEQAPQPKPYARAAAAAAVGDISSFFLGAFSVASSIYPVIVVQGASPNLQSLVCSPHRLICGNPSVRLYHHFFLGKS